jgi:hypothetical protein
VSQEMGENTTDGFEIGEEPVVARLRGVLRVLATAEMPGSTRKVLAYRAVDAARRPAESPNNVKTADRSTAIAELAEALSLVGVAAGREVVPWAKGWLREHCRARLASRLSRLSKARNSAAHPDVRLLADLQCMANDTSCSSEDRSELHVHFEMAEEARKLCCLQVQVDKELPPPGPH